jgi:uncharacterized membrane protein
MAFFRNFMEVLGTAIDGVGVFIIVAGACRATARFLQRRDAEGGASYQLFRLDLGKAIILGLEFMIAGDIIRTVAVSTTLENVAVLGLIILIRTFLSMALELEMYGRWPWQRAE